MGYGGSLKTSHAVAEFFRYTNSFKFDCGSIFYEYYNHASIVYLNLPVLSNEGKVSCSRKQRTPLNGFRTQIGKRKKQVNIDIKRHLSHNGLQTFQPIDTSTLRQFNQWRFNPYLFRHFNPYFEYFQPIHLSFSTPISKTSQPIYQRRFNPCQVFLHW